MTGNWNRSCDTDPEESYFFDSIHQTTDREAFIDCGTFAGDTVQTLFARTLSPFDSILAIEENALTYPALTANLNGLDPALKAKIDDRYYCAAFAQRGLIRFNGTGALDSLISERGTHSTEWFPIDALAGDKRTILIKINTGGAEFNALPGARNLIAPERSMPTVGVYHLHYELHIPVQVGH